MEIQKPTFDQFISDVDLSQMPYTMQIHAYLTRNGCQTKVETAKSGYVVSYTLNPGKKVIANFVFRKKGLFIRIYGDHVAKYNELLDTLPEKMQSAIENAGVCRRLLDPTKCNSRCPMGNVFTLRGETHKKCRYGNFLFYIDAESVSAIQALLENELRERSAS